VTRRTGLLRRGSWIIPLNLSESSLLWACSDEISAYSDRLVNAHFIRANIAIVSRTLIIRPSAQLAVSTYPMSSARTSPGQNQIGPWRAQHDVSAHR